MYALEHIGRTDNPHSVTKTQVGLGSVTNDVQTKAAVVPNTAPAAGQVLVGNAVGTAYAPVTLSLDGQGLDSAGSTTIIAPGTHAATSKPTPVDADELPLVDSAASNVLKKLTWTNLKATLKAYFDTLYQPISSNGSFTPVVKGQSTAGTQTYAEQTGVYTQMGTMVWFSIRVRMSALDGATAGNILVGGLPFTAAALGGNTNGMCNVSIVQSTSLPAGYSQFTAFVIPGSKNIQITCVGSGVGLSYIAAGNLTNSTDFGLEGWYRV